MQDESVMHSCEVNNLSPLHAKTHTRDASHRSIDKDKHISIPYCYKTIDCKLRSCRICCHTGRVTVCRETDPQNENMVC
jgi:hypothetical protein